MDERTNHLFGMADRVSGIAAQTFTQTRNGFTRTGIDSGGRTARGGLRLTSGHTLLPNRGGLMDAVFDIEAANIVIARADLHAICRVIIVVTDRGGDERSNH